ncbi:MAG: hypothetical protein A2945_03810 [Candidatus Liptonbacteria bacterium RIFCSPLOWO2_01_FULL_52_25]|uniref:GIY-YIG domain-containing protein n=1 Tax=Candidatus Liptonbacteria bacterium RIFCSPLOWO2_01_FULL_52_25 TaxID=1798650 RepID=A0A1G2CI93_9BACT|nr:MAG: hypothetical protein A2945_03810 [Candidatus Liptonbacteria bacterium RIFCSPLOWO2_01_FULL_52_25]
MRTYYVYIMANKPKGVLYVGVTNDIVRRVEEHKRGSVAGFTQRYHLHILVHYEIFNSPYDAIQREKRLKHWNRAWKIELIEHDNPTWRDLSDDF